MENTGDRVLDDQSPQWFVASGDQLSGPFTSSEVIARIEKHEISWAHYVWKSGLQDWCRVCESEFFIDLAPAKPSSKAVKKAADLTKPKVKKAAVMSTSAEPMKEWFLFFNHSQHGPFSFGEVSRYLKIEKINSRVHAWRDGMSSWQRLKEIPEFKSELMSNETVTVDIDPPKNPEDRTIDLRNTPRKPMVARLLLAHEGGVMMGICRDISVGGMQVLTDKSPGPMGTRIKINVTPTDKGHFDAFVAEGVVVRVLEDGRGFSFRFEKLKDDAKRAIEKYIES